MITVLPKPKFNKMENVKSPNKHANKLLFYGVLLFFFGLAAGLFVPLMANPRMGLSTHLEGVMNGIFLIVLGLIWNRVALPDKWLKITFGLTLYGTFSNFAAVLFAAITGAGRMMPIALGKEGTPIQEAIISFLLVSVSLAMLAVCAIVLVGLNKHINAQLSH